MWLALLELKRAIELIVRWFTVRAFWHYFPTNPTCTSKRPMPSHCPFTFIPGLTSINGLLVGTLGHAPAFIQTSTTETVIWHLTWNRLMDFGCKRYGQQTMSGIGCVKSVDGRFCKRYAPTVPVDGMTTTILHSNQTTHPGPIRSALSLRNHGEYPDQTAYD